MIKEPDFRVLLAEERTSLASERTQLAAERTLSAWLRTGLAGVGGGIGIIHFLRFKIPFHQWTADVVGELLIFWGIFIFIFAYVNYRLFCKRIARMEGFSTSQIAVGVLVYFLILFSVFFLLMTIHRLHFVNTP